MTRSLSSPPPNIPGLERETVAALTGYISRLLQEQQRLSDTNARVRASVESELVAAGETRKITRPISFVILPDPQAVMGRANAVTLLVEIAGTITVTAARGQVINGTITVPGRYDFVPDGDSSWVGIGGAGTPGATGATGATGPAGADGRQGPPARALDVQPRVIPGRQGVDGAAGATGPAGPDGRSVPPARPPEAPLVRVIPGARGDAGTSLVGTVVGTAIVNLGSAARFADQFDITGLSGLTTNQLIPVWLGVDVTRPDESEEQMVCSGYALNSTTIRVFWQSISAVSGTRTFAYQVPSSVSVPGLLGVNVDLEAEVFGSHLHLENGDRFGSSLGDVIDIDVSVAGDIVTVRFDFETQNAHTLFCNGSSSTGLPIFTSASQWYGATVAPGPATGTPSTQEGNGIITETQGGTDANLFISARGWDRRYGGFVDDFQYAQTASVSTNPWMGDTPWRLNVIAGTVSLSATGGAITNHPGSTVAVLSASSSFSLIKQGTTTGGRFLFGEFTRCECVMRYDTSIALGANAFCFGISSFDDGDNPNASTNGAFMSFSTVNWRCKTRKTDVETTNQDSGVALALNSWFVLTIERNPTNNDLMMYIDDVLVMTRTQANHTIATTDAMTCGIFYVTPGGVAAGITWDYISCEYTAGPRTS